ncbi:putative ferrochelatase [Nocardioides baekrokdamisoli]|uniref:Coproporphyrin III ferrochelatase n=1 Tax=Nocardioides baekrokdamisoli TaxID=1804624 RepID=A0A3G9IQQ4_9ACTN|nr:ferrochelatase [Nocardioides baekrokdamisoli]BBH15961.1 putative ferrochelatase [Nocardioides baekrokdamisoli]
MDVSPYDALLLLSFGGPEKPDDVVPFLENVTRGRGIPRERLVEVGQHYFGFGGRSPINDQNKALIAALEQAFESLDITLPIYWGNRNWEPYLPDTVAQMAADGVQRALVLTTSAYASYSSCRQYRENLWDAVQQTPDAPVLDKLGPYFNSQGFENAVSDNVVVALKDLGDAAAGARLVFVTHSIPNSMAGASGPDGDAYVAQHRELARAVTQDVEAFFGCPHDHDLVFCSRSGPPQVPWLEPDVNDHLEALAADGITAAVLIPIGFVSDHMEVIYDLDTEAFATAQRLGMDVRRAGTAGTHPTFIQGLIELITERAAVERGENSERSVSGVKKPTWDRCLPGCCATATARPALCGTVHGQ